MQVRLESEVLRHVDELAQEFKVARVTVVRVAVAAGIDSASGRLAELRDAGLLAVLRERRRKKKGGADAVRD